MTLYYTLFAIFSLLAVFSAIAMITRTNPVISALFLILNFFSFAGLYLLLNAQFIAIIQILVYAGAIMVLFVFVIMLLNLGDEKLLKEKIDYKKVIAAFLSLLIFLQFCYVFVFLGKDFLNFPMSPDSINSGKVESIGKALFTTYLLPFEMTSILLIVAIIGAILLAKRRFE